LAGSLACIVPASHLDLRITPTKVLDPDAQIGLI